MTFILSLLYFSLKQNKKKSNKKGEWKRQEFIDRHMEEAVSEQFGLNGRFFPCVVVA